MQAQFFVLMYIQKLLNWIQHEWSVFCVEGTKFQNKELYRKSHLLPQSSADSFSISINILDFWDFFLWNRVKVLAMQSSD